MSRISLLSPAKLNLFLKVQNKRPDGFHNIITVFERVDLSDEMSFRVLPNKTIRIVCDHPHVPLGSKNLVYKVARLLQDGFNLQEGVEIKIKKRIPVAAGLAGGSSNAATALLGLNHIWKLNLSRAAILSYARKIGSDVAFFLYDTSWALGTERGDHIEKLKIKTKLWHILVVPCIKMYSWKVYGGFSLGAAVPLVSSGYGAQALNNSPKTGELDHKLQLTNKNDNVNILIRNLKKGSVLDAGRLLRNDLESVIIGLCPRLEKLKDRLKSLNTHGVMISGSGPAVFGLMATQGEAEVIKDVLLKRFSQVFVIRTL
jgi:4-diphosphocytidyl-2-C-methyl-D-erythritol kinase